MALVQIEESLLLEISNRANYLKSVMLALYVSALEIGHLLHNTKRGKSIDLPLSVTPVGLAPTTQCQKIGKVSHLYNKKAEAFASAFSDPGGARTHDPMIKSHLLYQLSHGVIFLLVFRLISLPNCDAKLLPFFLPTKFFGNYFCKIFKFISNPLIYQAKYFQ